MRVHTIPGYEVMRFERLATLRRREYTKWAWWTLAGLVSAGLWVAVFYWLLWLMGW